MATRPIDEKIVAMKMDNSDLISKAAETTSIFGKIKDALSKIPGVDVGKVAQSFGEIQNAASRVNLNSISDNVEKLSGRFTNLGIAGMAALTNITNKVVDMGLQLAKNTFIQPILDGFHEYETKMGSIQTILANTQAKGTTLNDVKNSLAELNTYADKTIYSFSDMTKNIGFFTNAGLGLKESTSMIKGFSNAAAASGSNAEQAANAAYQLSQGLSAGYIMTQDWMSLTNAGMGNDNMKRDLIAIGQAMGKLNKSTGTTDKTLKNWKDSLSNDKWLTSDVMSVYLQAMAGDMDEATLMAKGLTKAQADLLIQNAKTGEDAATKVRTWTQMMGTLAESVGSGWGTTFELIFGDFNQATDLWTGLTNAIGGFISIFDNARNGMVKSIADAGIFKGFFDIITKGADAVVKILNAIGDGFNKAFAGEHSTMLNDIGKGLEAFANALTPSAEVLKVITTIFQALFSVVRIVVDVLLTLGKILITIIKVPLELIVLALKGLVIVIGAVLNFIAKLVIAFTSAITSGTDLSSKLGGLQGVFSKIGSWIGKGVQALGRFGNALKEVWTFLTSGDISKIGPWAQSNGILDKLVTMRNAVKTFVKGVQQSWNVLANGSFDVNAGPFGANSKFIERLFAIREGVKTFVKGVQQAWNVLANGSFDSNAGPLGANSKIIEKLFAVREAVKTFVAMVVQAWNILAHGDFTGGPWEEDSRIVDALFKIRETVLKVVNDIVEAWHILTTGEISKKGPWGAESEIVSKLMSIRNTVIEFASGVKEAWSVLTSGELTKNGPWNQSDFIVGALLKIREGVMALGGVFEKVGSVITDFWNYLTKKKVDFKGPWDDNTASVWMGNIKTGANELTKAFDNFGGAMAQTWSILSKGVDIKGPWSDNSVIVEGLHKIRDACVEVGKYLSSLHLSLDPVANAFKDFFSALGKGFEWIKEKLTQLGKKIQDALPSGQKLLAGGFMAAMITISGFVLKLWYDLAKGMAGWGKLGNTLNETLGNIGDAFDSFSKTMKTNNTVAIIVALAIAIGTLALGLKLLSTIDQGKMTTSLIALTTVLAGIVGAMAIITKYDITGTGMKATLQIMGLSVAVLIMVTALQRLSQLNLGEISMGILGLVGILGTLSGALILISKFGGKQMAVSAIQFLMLSSAVLVMVDAVRELGQMKPEVLKQGLITLGFILLEMGLFFAMIGHTSFGIGDALAFLAIARAIDQIVGAIEQIGNIKVDVIKQGLLTIAGILLEIAIFAQTTKETGLLSTAVGLLLISAALTALIIPISMLGMMPYEVLAKGLGAMAIALTAIGLASLMMTGMVATGAGLILVAIALNMLLVPITALGLMSWETLIKGIVGLAGGMLLIGGAAALLGLASELILAFGVALLVVGAAMLLAGLGMSLFSAGLISLATMTSASITAIVATLGTLIAGLGAMMPTIINFVANTIVEIITAIATRIPAITAVIAQMLVGILTTIAQYIPQIVDAAVKIITNFLDALAQNLPKIVESAANLMVAFVDSLASAVEQNGPKFIDAVMRLMAEVTILIVEAGVAVIQALFGWIPGVTEATNNIGKTAEDTIRKSFGADKAGKDKGKEFADGLNGKSGDAKNAGSNVGKSAKDGADSHDVGSVGSKKGQDFVSALQAKASAASSSGRSLAENGKSGAGSVDMSSTGAWFGQGFADGISSKFGAVSRAASSLASKAKSAVEWLLNINSPSRVMKQIGGWFGEGFAIGIDNTNKMVGDSASGIASTAKDAVNNFLDTFELPVQDNEIHFKAVVDYDKLDASKFGNVPTLAVQPDVSLTNGLVSSTKASLGQNGNNNTSNVDNSSSTVINQNVNLQVDAKGYSTRAEIKKLAVQIQDELKNLNDRTKISRGEGVAF